MEQLHESWAGLSGQVGALSLGRPGEGGHLTQTLSSPLQADTEPVVMSGASDVVPRVLSGEPQNLCASS